MVKEHLRKIIGDLNNLFSKDEIKGSELDDFKDTLETKEVKNYIENIEAGSKPEVALRETFFNENSPFIKSLFQNFRIIPELSIKRVGFLDYKLEGYGINIIIELKPLFEAILKGKLIEKIKYTPLDWQKEKKQIYKYIKEEDYKYAILTDLKKWYFFSKSKVYNEEHIDFIYSAPFEEFITDLQSEENLVAYLERIEHLSIKENLDKKFFDSLKEWILKLGEIRFTCSENDKIESIVYLINKFIFIQTLDDYGIIEINKIRKVFSYWEQKYHAKGDYYVLKKFLEDINDEFYEYYDTELFANHQFMDFVDVEDNTNLNKLSKALKSVLGLSAGQTSTRWVHGISHYNFKFIDEDILGKAYETFLAEVRKEQGIYYTPPYITKYISENTVCNLFDEKISEFKDHLEKKRYEKAKDVLLETIRIKVLDPACGSGSFLIKSLRLISKKYQDITQIFDEQLKKYGKMNGLEHEHPEDYEQIRQILSVFKTSSRRELLSKILVRHIHGNDLDAKALEVAKVNLWLEAIKLAPQDFKAEVIGHFHNSHVLPNLSMNLGNGNSLVGLPEKETIEFIKNNLQKEIKELFKERNLYLQDTTNPEHIGNILAIKKNIQKKLNDEFEKYLTKNNLPLEIKDKTLPFHWALEFWYCFFNEDGTPKEHEHQGFDAIIGNPPYVDYRSIKPVSTHMLLKKIYSSANVPEKYNIYVIFIEKGLRLLKKNTNFGYINPTQWMGSSYGFGLRQFILNNHQIIEIDDLSRTDVFEDPTLTNLGLFFLKSFKDTDRRIKLGYRTSKDNIEKNKISFVELDIKDFFITDELVFRINPDKKIRETIRKILNKSTYLEKFVKLEWGTSQSGYGKKKISYGEFNKLSLEEKKQYAPLIQTGDIDRHIISWQGEYIQKNIFSSNKQEQFRKPKLVFSRRSSKIRVAYEEGESFLGKVAFTSSFKKDVDLDILNSILNSSLINFLFIQMYETIHPGGSLRIDIPYLNKLPLMSFEKSIKLNKSLKKLVDEIILYKKIKNKSLIIWQEYSTKYKNNQRLLREILVDDKREIRDGNFKSLWTSEASIYPDENNEILKEEFNEFMVISEDEKILKILGINPDAEKELLQLKFTKKELRDLVYLELITALESRSRIKTLKDILDKTSVSIIQPNAWENSINLIKGAENKFKEWAKENKILKELASINLTEIDQKIEDTDAEIDANVFKLYELDEDEIKLVMDSLNMPQYYQEKVFNFFKKLK